MIKNLILTFLLSGFTASNAINYYQDLFTINDVNELVTFNVDFIKYYNDYTDYGNITYQLENDSVEIEIDTGINLFYYYPTFYEVYNDYILWGNSNDNSFLTFDNLGNYNFSYQGSWSHFTDCYLSIATDALTLFDYVLISYIYSYVNTTTYNFNSGINYNAPYNATRSPYIGIDNNAGLPRWDKTINLGYFISNGALYTEMIMSYIRIDGAYPTYFTNEKSTALIGGEENIFKGADGYYYANELVYYNRYTQRSTRVWLRNSTYLGDKKVIVNGGTWVNSNYTTYTILGDFVNFTEEEKDNAMEVLGLFNDGSFTAVTPPSSEVTSVFELLGKAFSSLGGILNITVFPGVTLGLLLCIPFFAMVLLFIVGLFKR